MIILLLFAEVRHSKYTHTRAANEFTNFFGKNLTKLFTEYFQSNVYKVINLKLKCWNCCVENEVKIKKHKCITSAVRKWEIEWIEISIAIHCETC